MTNLMTMAYLFLETIKPIGFSRQIAIRPRTKKIKLNDNETYKAHKRRVMSEVENAPYADEVKKMLHNQGDKDILIKTPIVSALEKDGRFKPVYYSKMNYNYTESGSVPTIWMKVK